MSISLDLNLVAWFRKLTNIDRFTLVLAIFTGFLAFATCMQVVAFIASERAQLVIDDITFIRGEPSPDPRSFDVIIKLRNFGKHVANVTKLTVSPLLSIYNKTLPSKPNYDFGDVLSRVPPIAPDGEITLFGGELPQKLYMGAPPKKPLPPREDLVAGLLDGSIPFHIYGFIDYYNGYSVLGPSEIGYCFVYIPPARRLTGRKFEVRDSPNYIYTQ